MQAQPLRPIGANPIEISDYLKPIADSRTILVKKVIEDYFEKNKLVKTLSELKRRNKFLEPDGVKPDEDRTLQTVLDRIKKNPDKSFTMSDVWYPCNIVYVFKHFNRVPTINECMKNLNYRNRLNWGALDTPATYIAMYMGNIVLISTKGGHRTVMVMLSEASFDALMPGRITYIGTLDYERVVKEASGDHHYDSNKRNTQNARDRLRSGVAAEDYQFEEIMKALLDFKLYDDKESLTDEHIKQGFRQITSWQSLVTSIKENGYVNTEYAVSTIAKNVKDTIITVSQSVETIANFKNKFGEQIRKAIPSKDKNKDVVLDTFFEYYFMFHTQSDLRVTKETQANTFLLATMFNTWARKQYNIKSPIQSKHFNDVYEHDNDLPSNFNVRQLNGTA